MSWPTGSTILKSLLELDMFGERLVQYLMKLLTLLQAGYSPSEPFFVSRPGATSETDGVLLSLVSAFEGHSHLRPFMLILDPIEMTEIARIWLPEDYDISVSFHGIFVKH
jgi:carotenoid cleavage dioxygenase-like enzyme